jgi:hypothetical protein
MKRAAYSFDFLKFTKAVGGDKAPAFLALYAGLTRSVAAPCKGRLTKVSWLGPPAAEDVQAEYKDGVLHVHPKKSQEAMPKRIEIKSG